MRQQPRRSLRRRTPRSIVVHHDRPAGAKPWRAVPRDGSSDSLSVGLRQSWFGDLYHHLLGMGWCRFMLLGSLFYIATNVLFALAYLIEPMGIGNAQPGSFWDAFFFSVETLATIGYGQMYPATLFANLVMTFETIVGIMVVAVATGLVFARFSRPTARVMFSRIAVIGPYNGTPTLSLRLANQRRNQILEAEVAAALLRDETTAEGTVIRRFHSLRLARERTPAFGMTFTVMHPIEPDSPFYGLTPALLEAQEAELVVMVTGLDETMLQPVHARSSYLANEIRWDHRLVDIIGWTEDGRRIVDYRRFHDAEPLQDES